MLFLAMLRRKEEPNQSVKTARQRRDRQRQNRKREFDKEGATKRWAEKRIRPRQGDEGWRRRDSRRAL